MNIEERRMTPRIYPCPSKFRGGQVPREIDAGNKQRLELKFRLIG